MASEKDPSIYDDRDTIGSSNELDEYGVWVKSEPQDLPLSSPESGDAPEETEGLSADIEDLPDFVDLEEEAEQTDLDTDGGDFIFSDVDLPSPEEDFGISPELSSDMVLDDFLEDIPDNPPSPGFDEPLGEEDFSAEMDISGTGVLESPPAGEAAGGEPRERPAAETTKPDAGLSTQLLLQIANELSSIKSELSSLKRELTSIRGEMPPAERPAPAETGGGFFDAEDDEKIALTGDEMDNILHTADFTEETGLAEDVEEDFTLPEENDDFAESPADFAEPSADSVDFSADFAESPADSVEFPDMPDEEAPAEMPEPEEISLAGETEEFSLDGDFLLEEPGDGEMPGESGEDLQLDDMAQESMAIPDLPDISQEEIALSPEDTLSIEDAMGGSLDLLDDTSLDLRQLQEDGVEYMTSAPEDTSYLDEETLAAADAGDEAALDLSDPVADEPEVEDASEENPGAEPSIEAITLDLDLEEPLLDEGDLGMFDEPLPGADMEDEIIIDIPTEGITEFIPDEEPVEEEPIAEEPPAEEPAEEPLAEEPEEEEPFVIPEGFEEEALIPDETLGEDFGEPFAEDAVIEGTEPEGPGDNPADLSADIPTNLKRDLKSVLTYMDQLLESLPEEKIEEFAKSEYFDTYKKLFEELGIA